MREMTKTGNTSRPERKGGWRFRIAAALLSLILASLAAAVLLELCWRLFTPDIRSWLIEVSQEGERVLIGNPNAHARREIKDALLKVRVPLDDSSGPSIDVFVLGGSNIAGYFGGPNMTPPRMIEFFLQQALEPGKEARVHNLGIAGGASSHARRLVEETLDAGLRGVFVLHMGHNEFLPQNSCEVLARHSYPRLHRFTNWLWRSSAFYLARFPRYPFAPSALTDQNGILDRLDTPEWRGLLLSEYRANLEAMVQAITDAGSRVVLSTVVPNIRFHPFRDSDPVSMMTDEEVQRWDRLAETGLKALHTDAEDALRVFLQMREMDRGHSPFLEHLIARAYERAYNASHHPRFDHFREHYFAALEHDRGPLRAPKKFNDAMGDIAREWQGQVAFVDCFRIASQSAASGVPGSESARDWNHLWPEAYWHCVAIPLAEALADMVQPDRAGAMTLIPFAHYEKERPVLDYQMCTYAAMAQLRFHEPETALASLRRGSRAKDHVRANLRELARAMAEARAGDFRQATERVRRLAARYGLECSSHVGWDLPLDVQQNPAFGRMIGIARSLEREATDETTRLLHEFELHDADQMARLIDDAACLLDGGDTVRDIVEGLAMLEMGRLASALRILRRLRETKPEPLEWLMLNDGVLSRLCHHYVETDKEMLTRPQDHYAKARLGRGFHGLEGYPHDPKETEGTLRIGTWSREAELFVDATPVPMEANRDSVCRLGVGHHWLLVVSPDKQRFLQESLYVEPGTETEMDVTLDQLDRLPPKVRAVDGHLISAAGERMHVYRFRDGRTFLIPETAGSPPDDWRHGQAATEAEQAGGELLTHGDWVEIFIGGPQESILDRLQDSLERYLDQLDGSPRKVLTGPMIRAREESGEPWKEFVSPDQHTGGKPAYLSLDGPRLDLRVVEQEEPVPGARVRIVYPLRAQ